MQLIPKHRRYPGRTYLTIGSILGSFVMAAGLVALGAGVAFGWNYPDDRWSILGAGLGAGALLLGLGYFIQWGVDRVVLRTAKSGMVLGADLSVEALQVEYEKIHRKKAELLRTRTEEHNPYHEQRLEDELDRLLADLEERIQTAKNSH